MIELENLVKQFGDLTAVDNLSLTVEKGEFVAVLGPNAAGKTTTIKMLVGLIKPNAGTVRVCGIDVQADLLEPVPAWCLQEGHPRRRSSTSHAICKSRWLCVLRKFEVQTVYGNSGGSLRKSLCGSKGI